MIKNIIFDFDGVLADTFPFGFKAVTEINKELRLLAAEKINPEDLRSQDMQDFFNKFKVPKIKLLLLLLKYRRRLSKNIQDVPTFNGLPQALKELVDRGVTLGIVTSNQKNIVQKFLTHREMKYFGFIFSTISLFHKEKLLSSALKKFKLAKDETIYVGDETRDIKAARAAGLKVAAVTWGYNLESKLEEYKPDFMINTPKDLLSLIK
jgi:phosphoglycolate phosphatase